jgi:hypothetical protein
VTGLLALWAVAARWWMRHLDTALHEAGHALFAWANGWKVLGVEIGERGDGLTEYLRPRSNSGAFAVSAAGYASPSLVGLGSAALLATGNLTAAVVLAVLALLGLLLVVRNRFGIAVVLTSAAGLAGLEHYAPRELGLWVAYFVTWFLLLHGVKSVVELHRARRHGARDSDADKLATLTRVPAFLWVLAFGALSVLCLAKGAALLLG